MGRVDQCGEGGPVWEGRTSVGREDHTGLFRANCEKTSSLPKQPHLRVTGAGNQKGLHGDG